MAGVGIRDLIFLLVVPEEVKGGGPIFTQSESELQSDYTGVGLYTGFSGMYR